MSGRLKKTFAASFLVAATGCELVAGIHDLSYSAPADEGGSPSGNDATMDDSPTGTDGNPDDANGTEGGSIDRSVPGADVADTGSDGDSTSAAESSTDGSVIEGASESGLHDGALDVDGGDTGPIGDASDAETGPVSYTVPIPGPDGGPIGVDGGVLLGELIDDMESDIGWILSVDKRDGPWFTYNDGTSGGLQTPAPMSTPSALIGMLSPPRGASMYAVHVTGSGFAQYAGFGFDFSDPSGTTLAYDASAYKGVMFWGRLGSGTGTVEFAMPDRNTAQAGGVCSPAAKCSDYFSKNLPTFTTSWQQFTVLFGDLRQQGWGSPQITTGLDALNVYACQFQVAPPLSSTGFDIWVDDIYFIDK